MRNELRKRLKGWMALVLCVGMMFGNSMMVFAGETPTYRITNVGQIPNELKEGETVNAGDTIAVCVSGKVVIRYYTNNGNQIGGDQVIDSTTGDIKAHDGVTKWRIDNASVDRGLYFDLVPYLDESNGEEAGYGAGYKEEQKGTYKHEHSFEWDMTKVPTRTEDGEASYICRECGYVAATQPATRWQWFMKQYRDLVKNAEQNATVTFEADDMPCISDYMLGFNADRPDVTMIVHFTYAGVNYELTIPAGTDFSALRNDTDAFYGYLGLAAKLGLTVNVLG